MLFWVLSIIYELLFVCLLYGLLYWGIDHFMCHHAKVFKIIFNVDILYFKYLNETGTKDRHKLLHLIASSVAFLILSINPVVHSFIFAFFKFLDVTQINRLVLYSGILRLLINFNLLMGGRWEGELSDYNVVFLAVQTVFTAVNFWNRAIAVPSIFYLVDEFFDIHVLLKQLKASHDVLIGFDDCGATRLTSWIAWWETRKVLFERVRILALGGILLMSIVSSDFKYWSEVPFYYAGTTRLVFLYNSKNEKEF